MVLMCHVGSLREAYAILRQMYHSEEQFIKVSDMGVCSLICWKYTECFCNGFICSSFKLSDTFTSRVLRDLNKGWSSLCARRDLICFLYVKCDCSTQTAYEQIANHNSSALQMFMNPFISAIWISCLHFICKYKRVCVLGYISSQCLSHLGVLTCFFLISI